jgi:hypothetical protein
MAFGDLSGGSSATPNFDAVRVYAAICGRHALSNALNKGSGRLAAPAMDVVAGGRLIGGIGMFVAFFLSKRELDE